MEPALIMLLSDSDAEVARSAAVALSRMKHPTAEDAVRLYEEVIANK